MDVPVRTKGQRRWPAAYLPFSKIVSRFSFSPFHPDSFLLSTKCVFYPKRSGGLFIKFCLHEVPLLLPCRMEANSFADSRHNSSDAGRSPKTKRFLFIFIQVSLVCSIEEHAIKYKIQDFSLYVSASFLLSDRDAKKHCQEKHKQMVFNGGEAATDGNEEQSFAVGDSIHHFFSSNLYF